MHIIMYLRFVWDLALTIRSQCEHSEIQRSNNWSVNMTDPYSVTLFKTTRPEQSE